MNKKRDIFCALGLLLTGGIIAVALYFGEDVAEYFVKRNLGSSYSEHLKVY